VNGAARFWPAGLMAAVAVLSFPGVLDGDRVFFQRDVGGYWYPQVATVRSVILSGAWPVWDPFEGFGGPLLGDPGSQVLYPPAWPALVLPPALHFKLFTLGHVAFSALGLFLLGRRLGLGTGPSLVAAFTWQVAGPFLSLVSMHHLASAAWMPWVLLALERFLEAPGARRVAALAGAAALQSLGGSADMCLATAVLGSGRLLLQAGWWNARVVGGLAASSALALGLAAPLWFTAAGVLAGSSRAAMGAAATFWSVHPWSLVDLVAVRLVADLPLGEAARALLFEGREPLLGTMHLGAPMLGLALLGAATGRRARWVALGALLLVVMALGRHGPAPALLLLPPFSWVRYPAKYLVPAALAIALLAGAGARAWMQGPRKAAAIPAAVLLLSCFATVLASSWIASHSGQVLAWLAPPAPGLAASEALLVPLLGRVERLAVVLALGSLLFALRARPARPHPILTGALVAMVAVLGLTAARSANTLGRAEVLAPPGVLRALSASRILALQPPPAEVVALLKPRPGWTLEELYARTAQECLHPPVGARWGLHGSFDGDPTLLGAPAQALAAATVRQLWGSPFALRMLELGSVDHVVACGSFDGEGLLEVARAPSLSDAGGSVRVLRVPRHLPRVYAVPRLRVAASADEAWHVVGSVGFDPWREAVIESGGGEVPDEAAAAAAPAVEVLEERADRLRARVRAESRVLLVVTGAWASGWRAWVDGQAATVHRANLLFRATVVPPGDHVVEWRYRPREVAVGAVACAVSLAACGLMLRRPAK
jgi:hypothetical protein